MPAHPGTPDILHRLSVVTPVYQGEKTLGGLAAELLPLAEPQLSPAGHAWVVTEWLLVYDHGPDGSADVIAELARDHDLVRPVWLSRNFGQHAATLAGMASSSGDWIVTLDEDGQHDPGDLGTFLDAAMAEGAGVVYARPTDPPPHGPLRNGLSVAGKRLFGLVAGPAAVSDFQSFRLVLGEIGRSVAAYAGSGVFLDVALGWVTDRVAYAPTRFRDVAGRRSGYTARKLLSHFWRLVLTSGTHGLRLVSASGIALAALGLVYAGYVIIENLLTRNLPPGWTTTLVVILIASGATLFCLGVIAEYIGVAVNMAMGKPLYLIVGDPADGPLGRRPGHRPPSAP